MPRYSKEFKLEVLCAVSTGIMSNTEAAWYYKINPATLRKWRSLQAKTEALANGVTNGGANGETNEEAKSTRPCLPSHINIRTGIFLYTACESVGFKSPEAENLCRKYSVKPKEILALKPWINKCDDTNALVDCLANVQELSLLRSKVEQAQINQIQTQQLIDDKDHELDKLNTEVALAKKVLAILS